MIGGWRRPGRSGRRSPPYGGFPRWYGHFPRNIGGFRDGAPDPSAAGGFGGRHFVGRGCVEDGGDPDRLFDCLSRRLSRRRHFLRVRRSRAGDAGQEAGGTMAAVERSLANGSAVEPFIEAWPRLTNGLSSGRNTMVGPRAPRHTDKVTHLNRDHGCDCHQRSGQCALLMHDGDRSREDHGQKGRRDKNANLKAESERGADEKKDEQCHLEALNPSRRGPWTDRNMKSRPRSPCGDLAGTEIRRYQGHQSRSPLDVVPARVPGYDPAVRGPPAPGEAASVQAQRNTRLSRDLRIGRRPPSVSPTEPLCEAGTAASPAVVDVRRAEAFAAAEPIAAAAIRGAPVRAPRRSRAFVAMLPFGKSPSTPMRSRTTKARTR